MLKKNHKLAMLSTILFLSVGFLFQNCSMSKFASGTDSSTEALSGYAPQSISGPQSVLNGNVILKEYRHKDSNRFFYTSRINDQAAVESTPGVFEITGHAITIRARYEAGLSGIHRLFNKTSFHFYTADVSEYNFELADSNYSDEGIEGYAIKISPRSSCPTSPNMTYPVYRLLHSGNYKYRLVSDTNLKATLLSQGYTDQGIAFCATGVSSYPPVTINNDCSLNGVTVANGTSITAFQSASVSAGSTCSSELRTCRNGALSGSYTSNSCAVNSPIGGNASCAFNNSMIAHGQTVTGYSASSATVCSSQQVTCNNGTLSLPSYSFGACTVTTPPAIQPPVAAKCTNMSSRVNETVDANTGYKQFVSSGMIGPGGTYTIRVNVSASSSTVGLAQNVLISHTEGRGAQRALRTVTVSPCIGDFTSSEAIVLSTRSAGSTDDVSLNEAGRGVPNLTTGTWYINVKNVGGCSTTANCDMIIDWLHLQN